MKNIAQCHSTTYRTYNQLCEASRTPLCMYSDHNNPPFLCYNTILPYYHTVVWLTLLLALPIIIIQDTQLPQVFPNPPQHILYWCRFTLSTFTYIEKLNRCHHHTIITGFTLCTFSQYTNRVHHEWSKRMEYIITTILPSTTNIILCGHRNHTVCSWVTRAQM